jgi:hypothetical protein
MPDATGDRLPAAARAAPVVVRWPGALEQETLAKLAGAKTGRRRLASSRLAVSVTAIRRRPGSDTPLSHARRIVWSQWRRRALCHRVHVDRFGTWNSGLPMTSYEFSKSGRHGAATSLRQLPMAVCHDFRRFVHMCPSPSSRHVHCRGPSLSRTFRRGELVYGVRRASSSPSPFLS